MTSADEGGRPMVPEPEPHSHATEQPADDEPAELEVEVSDLRAPEHKGARAHSVSSGARTGMPVAWYRQRGSVPRWLASACMIALLLLLFVDLVPDFAGKLLAVIAPTPTASPLVFAPTSTPFPTSTPVPTPTLAGPALGPAPADCPSSTGTPHVGGFPNQLTYAVGGPEVWVDGFDSPRAVSSITHDVTGPYTQWGWPVQIALVLRHPFDAAVTLKAHDWRTNVPLWWAFLGGNRYTTPTPTFTIDPQQTQGLNWSDDGESRWWTGALYLPGAGCYTLSASWPGGSWTATFAAGR